MTQFPQRITAQWLWRTIPAMEAEEYETLLDTLLERGWLDTTPPVQTNIAKVRGAGWPARSNLLAMLDGGLQPAVRRVVHERRKRVPA